MTVFDDERAALARTPQELLVLGVPYCDNHYASGNVQNLLLWTEDFANAAWTKTGCTITSDDVESPVPGVMADRVVGFSAGDSLQQAGIGAPANNPFNDSVWMRVPSGTADVVLRLDTTVGPPDEQFGLLCTLTTTWKRFTVSGTFGGSELGAPSFKLLHSGAGTYDFHVWGAQMVPVLNLLSYRKNEGSRNFASRCNAVDQGDGKRCYYTQPTCQDPANLHISDGPLAGLKEYRYCLKDAPLPFAGEDVAPLIIGADHAAQAIDPEKSITVSDRIVFRMADDAGPGLWDAVKASEVAKVNTAVGQGNYWPRFLGIHKNYGNPRGYAIRKAGFVAAGMTESLYEQKGRYLLRNIVISSGSAASIRCADRLKLLREKLPAKISQDNLLNGAVNNSQLTGTVDDASELTPPGPGYTVTIQIDSEKLNVTGISGDVLTWQRGRWGTAAASHSDNAVWTEIVEFGTERTTPSLTPLGKNPLDIVVELWQRGGIAAADIDTATFAQEKADWIPSNIDPATGTDTGTSFRRTLTEQTDIETLIRSIREEILLDTLIGDDQKVTGRIFAPARPSETLAELSDETEIVKGSIEIDDNDESRLTRVLFAWDLIPGESGDKIEDYVRRRVRIDAELEAPTGLGMRRQRVVLSKWIKAGDSTTPDKYTQKMLARYRNGARKVTLLAELRSDAIQVGKFSIISSAKLQTTSGARDSGRVMQCLRKERDGKNRVKLLYLDTSLYPKYGFIAPTGTPDYPAATANQRRYGFIGTTLANRVNNGQEDGFRTW